MKIYDKRAIDGHEFDSMKYDEFKPPAFRVLRQLPLAVLESLSEDMALDLELLHNLSTTDIMSIDVTKDGPVPTPGLISDLAPEATRIYNLIRPTYNNLTVLSSARYRQSILAIERTQTAALSDMATKFLGVKGFLISEKQRRFHHTIEDIAEARLSAIDKAVAAIECEIDEQEKKNGECL